MKLSDKYSQLVISPSGKVAYESVHHVYLKNNGTVTGRLCDGTKVMSQRTPLVSWSYQLCVTRI